MCRYLASHDSFTSKSNVNTRKVNGEVNFRLSVSTHIPAKRVAVFFLDTKVSNLGGKMRVHWVRTPVDLNRYMSIRESQRATFVHVITLKVRTYMNFREQNCSVIVFCDEQNGRHIDRTDAETNFSKMDHFLVRKDAGWLNTSTYGSRDAKSVQNSWISKKMRTSERTFEIEELSQRKSRHRVWGKERQWNESQNGGGTD